MVKNNSLINNNNKKFVIDYLRSHQFMNLKYIDIFFHETGAEHVKNCQTANCFPALAPDSSALWFRVWLTGAILKIMLFWLSWWSKPENSCNR